MSWFTAFYLWSTLDPDVSSTLLLKAFSSSSFFSSSQSKQLAFRSHVSSTRCQFVCFSVLIVFFVCFLYVYFFSTVNIKRWPLFSINAVDWVCFWLIRTLTSELVKKLKKKKKEEEPPPFSAKERERKRKKKSWIGTILCAIKLLTDMKSRL